MARTRRSVLLAWGGVLGVCAVVAARLARAAASGASPGEGDLERRARAVEGALIAPCCFTQTVANHGSPQAEEIKREIRFLLSKGWSEEKIVAAFLERYGERILAEPQSSGFGVLAYLVPPLFVVLGAALVAWWARRHLADRPDALEEQRRFGAEDTRRLEKLRAELARLE